MITALSEAKFEPIMMFHPLASPTPPEKFEEDNSSHIWKVKKPTARKADGSIASISPAKAILNWQPENIIKQNLLFQKFDESQERIKGLLNNKLIHYSLQLKIAEKESKQLTMRSCPS